MSVYHKLSCECHTYKVRIIWDSVHHTYSSATPTIEIGHFTSTYYALNHRILPAGEESMACVQNSDEWAVRGMLMGDVRRCLMQTACMLLERGCRQEWKAGERDGERTERKAGRKTWKPQKKVLSLFSWESASR